MAGHEPGPDAIALGVRLPVPPSEHDAPLDAELSPAEERLFEMLLERLQRLGVTRPPEPRAELEDRHAARAREDRRAEREDRRAELEDRYDEPGHPYDEPDDPHAVHEQEAQRYDQQGYRSQQPWKWWQGQWSSWDWHDTKAKTHDNDRPYLSHLDFPKFDGRKEEYANYKYRVMNLMFACLGIDLESRICRYLCDSPHVCLSGDGLGKHKLSLFAWFSPCLLVWGWTWKAEIVAIYVVLPVFACLGENAGI